MTATIVRGMLIAGTSVALIVMARALIADRPAPIRGRKFRGRCQKGRADA